MMTKNYIQLFPQVMAEDTLDKDQFEELYENLRLHFNIEDEHRRYHFQDNFANAVTELLLRFPDYRITLRRLVKNDDSLEYVKESLLHTIDRNTDRSETMETVREAEQNLHLNLYKANITLFNQGGSDIIQFANRNYLLLGQKGVLRIIDFDLGEQVTKRVLGTPQTRIDRIIGCREINESSPVHFITQGGHIIQAWHLNQTEPVFTIQADAQKLFLDGNGNELVLLMNNEEPNTKTQETFLQEIRVYDLNNKKEIRRFIMKRNRNSHIRMSPNASYLYEIPSLLQKNTTIVNKVPRVWSLFQDSVPIWLGTPKPIEPCLDVQITPDNHHLVTCSKVYNLPGMDFYTCFKNSRKGQIALSKDGQFAAIFSDCEFRIYNVKTGCLYRRIETNVAQFCPITFYFSPDNEYFFARSGDLLHIWNLMDLPGKIQEQEPKTKGIRFKTVPTIGIHEIIEQKTLEYRQKSFDQPIALSINQSYNGRRKQKVENAKDNSNEEQLLYLNPDANPLLKVRDYGTYNTRNQAQENLPGQASVAVHKSVLREKTSNIRPKVGTCFGLYAFSSPSSQRQMNHFVIKVNHPEIVDPTTNRKITQTKWNQSIGRGIPFFVGWVFENTAELQEGKWNFEIWDLRESVCYLRKSFFVHCKEDTTYRIETVFSGIYNMGIPFDRKNISTNFIIAYPGTIFGCKFRFVAPEFSGQYQLQGEIRPPKRQTSEDHYRFEREGNRRTTFFLRDGEEIDFTQELERYSNIPEGKWTFTLWDKDNKKLLLERNFELISPCHIPQTEVELVDYGLYHNHSNVDLNKNYPKAEQLELIKQSHKFPITPDMIFGFRLRLKEKQVGTGRQLHVILHHPLIKNLFDDIDHRQFKIYMVKGKEYFVGWVILRENMMQAGEWRFSIYDPEPGYSAKQIFETSFQLS
ncbi:MAG: DUF3859 domain-containing protein [Marinifilaceae bacterium]